jgi:hypothetical protein
MDAPEVSRADLLMWGPFGSETSLTYYEGPVDAVASLLDGVAGVEDVHLAAADGGTYAFVGRSDYEFEGRVLEMVAGASVTFVPPVSFESDGTVTFDVVGDDALVSRFYDDLTALGDVTIERVRPFRRLGSSSSVTDRQLEALSAALAVGYYEVPRTGEVADVADRLDCSKSTAGELLRKGEAAAVGGLVE